MSSADGGLARSSAIMAAGSLVSRVLGVVRASMIMAVFAFSWPGKAWTVATTLPNTVNLILAGGILNAVLVPQITKAAQRRDGGQAYVDRLLTLTLLLLLGVTVVCLPLAPLLVRLFAAGFDSQTFALAVSFTLIVLPAIFFYGLYTMLGQVLNARGQFGAFMWAPALCNVIWIAGLGMFIARFTRAQSQELPWTGPMTALMAGTLTVGVAAQALVLIVPLRRGGFRYRPRFDFRGAGLSSAGRVAGWTVASVLVSQAGFVVTSQVLTRVPTGDPDITGYQNAFLLFMTPHGLLTVSFVTALFTRMSVAAHRRDLSALRDSVSRGLRLTGLATLPVTVGTVALAPQLTAVLFAGNNARTTDAVAQITAVMMLGLAPLGVLYLCQRAFFAFEDARSPFRLQLLSSVIGAGVALGALTLPTADRATAVAAGAALSNAVAGAVGLIWVGRRLRGISLTAAIRVWVRSLAAALPVGLAAYLLAQGMAVLLPGRAGAIVTLVVAGPAFLVGFAFLAKAIGMGELAELARLLRRRG